MLCESQTDLEALWEEYKDANWRLRDLDMQCVDCIEELNKEENYLKEETLMKEKE